MSDKILITTSSFDLDTPEIHAIEKTGHEVILNPYGRRLTEDEVRELLSPDIVGMIAGVEPLTRNVIEKAENLRVISRCGAGLDSIDMAAANDFGITVLNTPDAPAVAVAELTIGLILDALRGISLQDRALREKGWTRPMGGLLGARTVGIIGFGHIGSHVARYAAGFGTKILAYDTFASQKTSDIAEFVELDDLLSNADIISLHIPISADTHHLINRARLQQMKKGAILINTARGGLVDEQALYENLKSNHLAGAALDVYKEEPYTGFLTKLDNITLTAHIGSYAKETRIKQETEAAGNLLSYIVNTSSQKDNRIHG